MARSPSRTPQRRNPSDLERALAGDKNLKHANLEGANLAGANLAGANLFRANLTGANLFRANLAGTESEFVRLAIADLAGANFTGANLYKAHLVGANLQGANLEGADLEGANLTGANLMEAFLKGVRLEGVKLVRADAVGANLEDAIFVGAKLAGANFARANLKGANLAGANLEGAILYRADFQGANLSGANLAGVNLQQVILRDAGLEGANLAGARLFRANLEGANLEGANLEGANLEGANLRDANVRGTILALKSARSARSYGRQTGAVLKMGKPDAPSRAAEFKRRYPAEFERLKADTQGRDFSDTVRSQVRQKYETPFVWLVTEDIYTRENQRLCPQPNLILKFNIALDDPSFTDRQREFLKRLAETSRQSGHPHEKGDLFTVGWVRLCVSDAGQTWLVEEVQSDVGVVRSKLKDGSAPPGFEQYVDVIGEIRPYIDRFYEDALGVVFVEAEKQGYAVEMLTYEVKQDMGSPRSVYTDLPRAMGMQRQKGSRVLPTKDPNTPMSFADTRIGEAVAETWYYKPNPRSSSRASGGRSTRSVRKRR